MYMLRLFADVLGGGGMSTRPVDESIHDRRLRVDIRVSSSRLRQDVSGCLRSGSRLPRTRIEIAGPDQVDAADARIVDQLPTDEPPGNWSPVPNADVPDQLVLVLEDVSYDDLTELLYGYNSFGLVLLSDTLDEIVNALEATCRGGYWLSPLAARRLQERCRAAGRGDRGHRRPGEHLTSTEQRILELILYGMSNEEIAEQLVVAVSTVKTHARGILRKTGYSNRQRLIASMLGKSSEEVPPWDEAWWSDRG